MESKNEKIYFNDRNSNDFGFGVINESRAEYCEWKKGNWSGGYISMRDGITY